MRCECPDLRRCCFCLPLRLGLLIAGYAEMVLITILIVCTSLEIHSEAKHSHPMLHSRFEATVNLVFYVIGLLMIVFYLYGLHRKLILPVKVYYYYSITTTLLSLVLKMLETAKLSTAGPGGLMYVMFELPLVIVVTMVQVYLLVLIYSFLKKLAVQAGPHQYENTLEKIIYVGETPRNGDLNQQDTTQLA